MPTPANLALPAHVWTIKGSHWALIVAMVLAAVGAFLPALQFMAATWNQVEEYGYGYFVPVISLFLIWQKAEALRELDLRPAWSGLAGVLLGLLLGAVGQLSAIRVFGQYGFVVALFGLTACLIGWRGTRIVAVPLALLFLMIPLPQFLLRELSQQLQLLSSQLGVALIRLFDISVFLEGNVIDLGTYKLQVVEACSGLRYLFPLIVLGCLAAHLFNAAWWKRVLLILSTVPLTIVINSLRIGLIGVAVEYWGSAMAEGLLHDFEGWFMFMVCIALLIGEMALLARLGARGQPLRAVFGLDYPEPAPRDRPRAYRRLAWPALVGGLALAAAAAYTLWSPQRDQIRPARSEFSGFPMRLDSGWTGRPDRLDRDVLATLALDDYLLANYTESGGAWVNLYSAYYASQSGGESTHSPRTCIPGGGWAIARFGEASVPLASGLSLPVNRAVIRKGEHRQLVYYWFDQRGRVLTDELAVKWYILLDGIVRHRSDGALLRLVTPIAPGEDEAVADRRLAAFLTVAEPALRAYLPR